MIGLYVSVPIACFRKGLAREYLETEQIPPPATCYGFLLSLVGETDRHRHIGARVTAALLSDPPRSVVLRTVWRIKHKDRPPGDTGNRRPDYQQLLTGGELAVWLDSTEESNSGTTASLEQRVRQALDPKQRGHIDRFGGLSLGESTHLVNEVSLLDRDLASQFGKRTIWLYRLEETGLLSLPVWVDHVGSAGSAFAVGNLVETEISDPNASSLPRIAPNHE